MLDQREETVGAVASPLDAHEFLSDPHFRFDERRPLAYDMHVEAVLLEEPTVHVPTDGDGFVGVVEEINVAGHAAGGDERIERSTTCRVTLAGGGPILRYESTESALEICESHRRR